MFDKCHFSCEKTYQFPHSQREIVGSMSQGNIATYDSKQGKG